MTRRLSSCERRRGGVIHAVGCTIFEERGESALKTVTPKAFKTLIGQKHFTVDYNESPHEVLDWVSYLLRPYGLQVVLQDEATSWFTVGIAKIEELRPKDEEAATYSGTENEKLKGRCDDQAGRLGR